MDFEKQKPITDAYRKGWERIWGAGCHLSAKPNADTLKPIEENSKSKE